ncbi:adrenodoxin-like [Spea bombifrons]|uniref:adrenodoxin-like n=1 Tax=Spea bombifrons TaxID=233779 RepID=UPI00234BB7F0|nr:adrenodoxin-like [Spea bombifrons]
MAGRLAGLVRTLLRSHQGVLSPQYYSASQAIAFSHVRAITSTARLHDTKFSSGDAEDTLTVNFINRDGEKLTATAKEGESLLEVVIRHHLNIDGFGACEGTLACSTCHLIFDQQVFEKLDPISDEEMDMLDLAFGLTDTSRLGCQVCMNKSLDGITVRVPKDISDIRKDVEVLKQSKQ